MVFPSTLSQCRSALREQLISVKLYKRVQRLATTRYQGEENSPQLLLVRFSFGSSAESFSGSGAVEGEPGCVVCLLEK